ncbi:MAG: TonB family protein [Acidobacteria bacterium]|nr:TonB family protein [Acidobacteriota bacterium]
MEKPAGQRIGRYQIVEKIGHGPMGSVYKAYDPMIKRHLAIKTIQVDAAPDSQEYRDFLERFYEEARTAGNLTHPNIITIYDVGEDEGMPYLVFEHVEGELLAELLASGAHFGPEGIILIVGQVAAALDYAHSNTALHKNLNPGNILVYHKNRLKVIDFGITTLGDADSSLGGEALKWVGYLAPERARPDVTLDHRSDIYSLAAIAYGLFTGSVPFNASSAKQVLDGNNVASESVLLQVLGSQGFRVDAWRSVFQTALSPDPHKRFEKAEDFVQALWDAQSNVSESLENFMQAGIETGRPAYTMSEDRAVTLAAPAVTASSPSPPPPVPEPSSSVATVVLPPRSAVPGKGGVKAAEEPSPDASFVPEQTTVLPPRPTPASTAQPTREAPSPEPEPAAPPRQGPAPTIPAAQTTTLRSAPRAKSSMSGSRAFTILIVLVLLLGITAGAYYLFTRPTPEEAVPQPVPQPPPPPPPATQTQADATPPVAIGSLELHTTPEGATVYVNGEAAGQTPVTRSELKVGLYTLRFELKGYETVEQAQEVLAGVSSPQVVQVPMKPATQVESTGSLKVTSTPPGATIMLDGKASGVTPKTITKLRAGKHVLEVSLEGHVKWAGTPVVKPGRTLDIAAEMQPVRTQPVKPPPPPPPPVETGPFALGPGISFDRRPVTGEQPTLPKSAKGVNVSVLVKIIVEESGSVGDIRIQESGGEALDRIVVETVRKWRFNPAIRGGKAVSVYFLYRFTFKSAK